MKDIIVAVSILLATVGCWAALTQKKKAKRQMEDMMKDIEALQMAETNLEELQEKLRLNKTFYLPLCKSKAKLYFYLG